MAWNSIPDTERRAENLARLGEAAQAMNDLGLTVNTAANHLAGALRVVHRLEASVEASVEAASSLERLQRQVPYMYAAALEGVRAFQEFYQQLDTCRREYELPRIQRRYWRSGASMAERVTSRSDAAVFAYHGACETHGQFISEDIQHLQQGQNSNFWQLRQADQDVLNSLADDMARR